jgi:tetratricopeptide (TPR) repeat protein
MHRIRAGRVCRGLWVLLAVCCISPQAEGALQTGADRLAQGDFMGALAEFDAVAARNPADGEASFFQGVALNRIGRFAAAQQRFDAAAKSGKRHPDFDFELGWSLLGQGKWSEAVSSLSAYEQRHPGRGQTSEFLGRAHLALGNDAEGERYLDAAVRRDPDLKGTADAARAVAARNRALRTNGELQSAATAASPIKLRGSVSTGAGYSTNVLGLSNDFANIPGLPKRAAGFFHTGGELALDWRVDERSTVTFSGGLQWLAFDGVSVANILDVTAGVDARRWFSDRWIGRVQAGYEHFEVGGDPYREQWQVRPSVLWRQGDASTTELAGTFVLSDYTAVLTSQLNRDSVSYGVELTQHLAYWSGRVRALAGGFFSREDSEGIESDGWHAGVKTGVGVTLPLNIEAESVYSVSFDRYRNPSQLSTSGEKRRGTEQSVIVQLSRAFPGNFSVHLRYAYQLFDSNVSFYEYDQHLWMAGVRWQF